MENITATALGPDGHLYYATILGNIYRQQLDPATGLGSGASELLYISGADFILGLEFDPDATAGDPVVWATFNGPTLTFSATIARIDLAAVGQVGGATRQDYITGLPTAGVGGIASHHLNQMDFGPDGKMYFNVGSQTPGGNTYGSNTDEVPLSAATLVADVNSGSFLGAGNSPVDVDTSLGYDPDAAGAKVTIFATGIRNGYDLVWHTNGNLYVASNGNDSGGTLPDDPGTAINENVSAPSGDIPEQLMLVVEDGYYGHPNSSRGEYISHGGDTGTGDHTGDLNLANRIDPWEVINYNGGVLPEPNWDAENNFNFLEISNSSSASPNGMAEYKAPTGLNGQLLIASFSQTQGIAAVELGADLSKMSVASHTFLTDENGAIIFASESARPLDLTVDAATGRIYVGGHDLSDSATGGKLWVLKPVASLAILGDANFDGVVNGSDFLLLRNNFGATGATWRQGDFNGDGTVNGSDFLILRNNFGATQ